MYLNNNIPEPTNKTLALTSASIFKSIFFMIYLNLKCNRRNAGLPMPLPSTAEITGVMLCYVIVNLVVCSVWARSA